MNAATSFVCCACDATFLETAAVQEVVAGFVEYSCPECGSEDVEDAGNLAEIQAMKREADSEFLAERQWEREERDRRDLIDAGRGHLVPR